MMKPTVVAAWVGVFFGLSPALTFAQDTSPKNDRFADLDMSQPMSLDETHAESSETQPDKGGFWMFPDAAPLTGKIATDRPAFSDTASLVPRGRIQIETGYTYSYDRENDRRLIDHAMPQLAFRTGLTDWLEFRAFWLGYSYTEVLDRITTPAGRHISDTNHVDGGTDLNLGFKLPILKQKDWMPNLSVIPSLYVPTGSDSKSFNDVVPELKFPWNYNVCKWFTAYGSILGRVPNSRENGQFFQTAATVAGGFHVHECVTIFTEYLGVYPVTPSEDCLHLLSAGPIIHITDNLSLDMRATVGLNEQAPDFQASIGFGFRF